jgi:uncharacterized protein (TIGR03437 family)
MTNQHVRPALWSVALVVGACALEAQQPQPHLQIKSFTVGPDIVLTYPNSATDTTLTFGFPDEHTTIVPPASPGGAYTFFGASEIAGTWGAVVLQTTDLQTFHFAAGYNHQVLASPLPFSQCDPAYANEFDENYAAPGSVLQDPTLPAGNLVMLYEAENHCPGGVHQMPFYATTGFARSADNGKTWTPPASGVLGGPNRYPVLQSPDPPPSVAHGYLGDALPSGLVDKSTDGNYYLYATYSYFSSAGQSIGVARAKLGANPLSFQKWYNGAFSQPGIGGSEYEVLPSRGCIGNQVHQGEITYNDDLGLYLMIYVCFSDPQQGNLGAWYYSTATSLDLQDWTVPQMIANSQYPVITPCPGQTSGQGFDGHYPSAMSPGAAVSHTKLTGYVFFMNGGCDLNTRQFLSRTFTITAQAQTPPVLTSGSLANGATYLAGGLVPGSWAQIKGTGLSNVARIWQSFDFNGLGNNLPTSLSGVQVMVNGASAPVYYIAPGQIDFQVPTGISGTASVQVINNGAVSNTITAAAVSSAPGIFPNTVGGTNYPAAVFPDGYYVGDPSVNSAYRNAKPGDVVELYATGLAAEPAGVLPTVQGITGVTVTIGNITVPASYAGQTPYAGEFQINFTVPQQFSSLAAGKYPLSIAVNGVSSPTTINSSPPGQLVLPIQP